MCEMTDYYGNAKENPWRLLLAWKVAPSHFMGGESCKADQAEWSAVDKVEVRVGCITASV